MIKESNERVQITLSKEQANWLKKFCKCHEITPSKYIRWLLSKKAEEMLLLLKVNKDYIITEEELKAIIQTKWLKD